VSDFIKTAETAAREAGAYLSSRFRGDLLIEKKGEIDLVTDADRESEQIIKDIILNKYPDHRILAEESGKSVRESDYFWLVDPLDGTTNYSHGFPIYCVSIALLEKGEIIAGCIYNPVLDEIFKAEKGKGAFLNGRSIGISKTVELGDSLLATGFPYDIRQSNDDNIREFTAFAKSARAVRRAGSAALDLAYVACGRFDGFWEFKLAPWDLAAGILMVTEAGGEVTAFDGGRYDIFRGEAIASNGRIHAQMLMILGGVR
jgi:myo-inositol-1(or 4)-monophosphatase